MIGRMMSLFSLGSMGTTPLGALIVGLVSDRVSPRAAVGSAPPARCWSGSR